MVENLLNQCVVECLNVQTIEVDITGDYIEVHQLLKITGVVASGGQGKALVASGVVTVDGIAESRKTAKIRAGQRVRVSDQGRAVVEIILGVSPAG